MLVKIVLLRALKGRGGFWSHEGGQIIDALIQGLLPYEENYREFPR